MQTVTRAIMIMTTLLGVIAPALQAQQPKPGNLTATLTNPTTVVLSWTAAGNATRYWVQRSIGTANFANLSAPKITGTTYTDAGAPAGTAIRYRVIAGFSSGPNSYGTSINVTTPSGSTASTAPPASSSPPASPASAASGAPASGAPASAAPASAPPAAPPAQPLAVVVTPVLVPSTPVVAAPTGVLRSVPGNAVTPTTLAKTAMKPAGPPPAGLTVTGTPSSGTVTWQPTSEAASFTVTRWLQTKPDCCRVSSPTLTTPVWSDTTLHWAGTYIYRVYANYPDGREGFADVAFTRPEPKDPAGFTATQTGEGEVELAWQAVPGVTTYFVGGPGAGNEGLKVKGTKTTLTGVPNGAQHWTVASWYEPGGLLVNGQFWPKASVNVVARSGKYRVMVTGLRSEHATVDDWWSKDGKWDEVYVSAFVQTFNRPSGQLLASATIKSPIHGDVNGFPPGARVRAGTASDLGGIVTSDNVSPILGQPAPGAAGYPQLVLWEGTLTSDREVVVLHPVLWEADIGNANTTAYNGWRQYFEGNPAREWSIPGVQTPDPQAATWFQEGAAVKLSPAVDWMVVTTTDKDRPIGVRNGGCETYCGFWLDQMLILTRERIERVLSSPYATGEKGQLEFRVTDHYKLPNGSHSSWSALQGDYVLILRVERIS